jgi:DNA-directed RNA polymerase subunit K/omega
LAENLNTEKFTTMALEEIAQGKIELRELAQGRGVTEKIQEQEEEQESSQEGQE